MYRTLASEPPKNVTRFTFIVLCPWEWAEYQELPVIRVANGMASAGRRSNFCSV
jgi:hypothetical protein